MGQPSGNALTRRMRRTLALFGSGSWLLGCIATFLANNDVAATSLIVVGMATLLLAAMGQWPERITVGRGEALWRREAVEQIEQVLETAPNEAIEPLIEIRNQLRYSTMANKAAEYDQQVEATLRRLFPDAGLYHQYRRAPGQPDFQLVRDGVPLPVETKYLERSAAAFRGRTLDDVAGSARQLGRLLVVTNSTNISLARDRLQRLLDPDRTDVITWQDPGDDPDLMEAITRLMAPAT